MPANLSLPMVMNKTLNASDNFDQTNFNTTNTHSNEDTSNINNSSLINQSAAASNVYGRNSSNKVSVRIVSPQLGIFSFNLLFTQLLFELTA